MTPSEILASKPFFTSAITDRKITFSKGLGQEILLSIGKESFALDRGQLAEFGALCMALGKLEDADSVVELLDGYGFTDNGMSRFANTLRQLAETIDE